MTEISKAIAKDLLTIEAVFYVQMNPLLGQAASKARFIVIIV